MEGLENKETTSFVKTHGDAIAVIAAQIATTAVFVGIMLSMISNTQAQVNQVNARLDTVQMLIYQEMKDFHGRLTILDARYPSFLERSRRVE